MSEQKIIIYTSPSCAFCHQAKEYLTQQGYKFEERDVVADSKYAEEAAQKSGQFGVPVIVVGEQVILGFDKEKLNQALTPPQT